MGSNQLVTALLDVVANNQDKIAASTMEKIHAIVEYHDADARKFAENPYGNGVGLPEVERHRKWSNELYAIVDRTEGLEAAEDINSHVIRELSPADLEQIYEKIDPKFFSHKKQMVASKQARVLDDHDQPNRDVKLQSLVGDPEDKAISWAAQFKPNKGLVEQFDPNSPIEGDNVFVSYLISGAKFQDKSGNQWMILDYPFQNMLEIENIWYPRQHALVSVAAVRRSIDSWIEPVQFKVPPPPPGVDYASLPVKIQK